MEETSLTSKRLEILKGSLSKKEAAFDLKLQHHFDDVKRGNGQPMNDKRNGRATLDRWGRQDDSLRRAQSEIEKTKDAIDREQSKIAYIERSKDGVPTEILNLVEKGELTIWAKHPNTYFVNGVEKARIVWDKKRKLVAYRYAHMITVQEQRSKFVKIYNSLHVAINPQ